MDTSYKTAGSFPTDEQKNHSHTQVSTSWQGLEEIKGYVCQLPSLQYFVTETIIQIEMKKIQTLSGQLSWSHYVEILKAEDELAILFYAKQCEKESWSVRELKRQNSQPGSVPRLRA